LRIFAEKDRHDIKPVGPVGSLIIKELRVACA
jgi:hypothetical protein